MEVNKDRGYERCAIYGRSSDEETMNKTHNSTEQQRYICFNLAKSMSIAKDREYKIVYDLIETKAVSGNLRNRPNYNKLIKLIKKGRVDVVFAKELSRLTRNIGDFVELLKLCEKHNVSIFMNSLSYIPSDPVSGMIVTIMAVIAKFERDLVIERTKSSIRSRAKNNSIIHGGRVILGFDRVEGKTGVWKVNEVEKRIVAHVMEIFLNSSSYAQAVREIKGYGYKSKTKKEFTREYLRRLLTNKKYIGKLKVPRDKDDKGSDDYSDLPTGALVSLELFEQVQKKIEKMEKTGNLNRRGKNRVYPLSGLIKSESGQSYTGAMGGKKIYYQAGKGDIRLDAIALENAVIDSFKRFENDTEMASLVREIVVKNNSRLDLVDSGIIDVQKEIDSLEGEIKGIIKTMVHIGDNEDAEDVVRALTEEMKVATNRKKELIDRLERLQVKRDDIRSESLECKPLKEVMKIIFNKLKRSNDEVKKAVFNSLIKEIKIFKGNKAEIVWIPEVCGRGGPFFDLGEKWGGNHPYSSGYYRQPYLVNIIEYIVIPKHLDQELLYQKYVVERLSSEEISKQLSTARTTILKHLKFHGIPVRKPGTNINRKRGLAYGARRLKRKEAQHKRELENIKKMQKLRHKGFSYWKIADVFNSIQIPTKSGRGKWHAKTISQILKNI